MLALKRNSQGTWYPWLKNEGVRFKVRPLSRKKMLELRNESKQGKVAVKMPMEDPQNPGRDLIEIVDDYNDALYEWKMFIHCLEDWEGITIESDIEPKKEEIMEAIFENIEMRRFIISKAFEVMSFEDKKFQDELKNLEGSPDG